jgi:hypothetical protein
MKLQKRITKKNKQRPANIVQISGRHLVVRGRRVHARFPLSFGQEIARNPPQKFSTEPLTATLNDETLNNKILK